MRVFYFSLILVLWHANSAPVLARSFLDVCRDRYKNDRIDEETVIVDYLVKGLERKLKKGANLSILDPRLVRLHDFSKSKRCRAILDALQGNASGHEELLDVDLDPDTLDKNQNVRLTDISSLKEFAPRIKRLNIHRQRVSDFTSLNNANELVSLTVTKSKLRRVPIIANLPKLTHLILSGNKITTFSDFDCYDSTRTLNINLAKNKIRELGASLPTCRIGMLNLSDNLITTVPRTLLVQDELGFLDLSNNLLQGTIPAVQRRNGSIYVDAGGTQHSLTASSGASTRVTARKLFNRHNDQQPWGTREIDEDNVEEIARGASQAWTINVRQYRGLDDLHYLFMHFSRTCESEKAAALLQALAATPNFMMHSFLNRNDGSGITAIISAIQNTNAKCNFFVKLIAEKAADSDVLRKEDDSGYSPLQYALFFENYAATELLLRSDVPGIREIFGTRTDSLPFKLYLHWQDTGNTKLATGFADISGKIDGLSAAELGVPGRHILSRMYEQCESLHNENLRLSSQCQALIYRVNNLEFALQTGADLGTLVNYRDARYLSNSSYRKLFELVQGHIVNLYLQSVLVTSNKFKLSLPNTRNQRLAEGFSQALGLGSSVGLLFPPASFIFSLLKAAPQAYLQISKKKQATKEYRKAADHNQVVSGNLIVAQKLATTVALEVIKAFDRRNIEVTKGSEDKAAQRIFEYLLLNLVKIKSEEISEVVEVIQVASLEIAHNWDELNKDMPNEHFLKTKLTKLLENSIEYAPLFTDLVNIAIGVTQTYAMK